MRVGAKYELKLVQINQDLEFRISSKLVRVYTNIW